ncbi:alpha/beta hydrolase [Glycomyces algeriensis]|uniref:Protease n=1 Tax=Glycomyces algeriensis TaxID=256037 RepID=A0A9W6LIA4_9ACTN|nr:alpha/beta hydrolase [Glycomyces algeriensis]MDA1364735.1 alpha/beta hydrolase [Glycomyces algeriensis]MDR7350776.1 pimeloyl-ACP methyl ester carboxylesterase [Glycomyces algeriensis]GLI43486.1 protease [Glycomyces algeriensis]
MKRTATLTAAVAVLAAAALASCGEDYDGNGSAKARSGVTTVQEEVEKVDWGPCDLAAMYGDAELNAEGTAWAEALECGAITVPVDYEDTGGDQVAIAMVRHPATGDRTGSLLVNPGGPGGSGIELAMSPFLPAEVTAAFDVVGFDPRGVGASENLTCGNSGPFSAALAEVDTDEPDSITDAEATALDSGSETFTAGCTEQVKANFLANMGTENVARDMEVMRSALGDDELTFLGYSYGTYIGQMYLYLYPDKVRAMVLDGVMRTSGSVLDLAEGQATGFETAWDDFIAYCLTVDGCPFTSADTADAALVAMLTDAQEAAGGRLTVGEMLNMIAESLYSEAKWPRLEKLLAAVDAGAIGELAQQLEDLAGAEGASRFLPRRLPPLPLPRRDTDANFYGVQCVDRQNPTGFNSYQNAAEDAYDNSALFGAGIAWSYLPCASWSASDPGPESVNGKGAPDVVLIGNTGDPATPYAWAESVAKELDSGVLLTYEGSGHTAYALGHTCIDDPVTAYLVDLDVPENGLRCPQELR